jgi:hypothetical protein
VSVIRNTTIYQDISLHKPGGAVRGTVRNAANNQGIAGASISAFLATQPVRRTYSAITDAGGNYALGEIPAGSLQMVAGADRFFNAPATVTIVVDQTAIQDFALTPSTTTGTITGTVVLAAFPGGWVPGANITVAGTNVSSLSGPFGQYTLSNVPAGPQTVSASREGFVARQAQVTVIAGQTVEQNFSLRPVPGTITGTVKNAATGAPIVGASVELPNEFVSTTSGAGGSYTLSDVASGTRFLRASANGFVTKEVDVTVIANQTITQDFSLTP